MHTKIISEIRNILGGENKDDKIMYDAIFKIVNSTVMLNPLGASEYKDPESGDKIMDREASNIGGHSKLKIENATDYPKTYYFKHMEKGIAHYPAKDITVLINDDALIKMQNTLNNKPIYIEHKDAKEDRVENLERNMHGVVAESFYNKLDGWFWSKVVIFTDKANDLIRKGWLISNSYKATELTQNGGIYHNIPYDLEIKNGIYDHIALVESPRYEGVMILTPEEYKKYNQELEIKLQNSNPNSIKRSKNMFNLFKKAKVEATDKVSEIFVEDEGKLIPMNELEQCFRNSEEKKEKKKEEEEKQICNAEEIDIDGKKVSVKELIALWKGEKAEKAEMAKVANEAEEVKISNAVEGNKHFDNVKVAIEKAQNAKLETEKKYDMMKDKLERGKKY